MQNPNATSGPAAWLAGVLAILPAAAREEAHPLDGPHLDLRIEVEDTRLHCAVQMNLACADALVDVAREDQSAIHPVEYPALRAELVELLRQRTTVEIDGVEVAPLLGRFDVYDADPVLVPLFPAYGARALITVRLDLDYPAKQPPERIDLVWTTFPPDVTRPGQPPREVTARVSAGGLESLVEFRPDAPRWVWRADEAQAGGLLPLPDVGLEIAVPPVRLPALSLACLALAALSMLAFLLRPQKGRTGRRKVALAVLLAAAAATTRTGRVTVVRGRTEVRLPTEGEALAVFRPLHANIYRAFDYTDTSDVYDALAQSVDGALLDRLYEEVYRGLVQEENEGAVGRVQSVTPIETEILSIGRDPDGAPAFDVRARWQVEGAVFHWGHSHWRTQESLARYHVGYGSKGWRIRASTIEEQFVVSAVPREGPPVEIPEEL